MNHSFFRSILSFFLFFLFPLLSAGQEVKLGLPVGHTEDINSLDFSSDNKMVLTSSGDNTARIWHTDSGKLLHTLEGHTGRVFYAEFSSDNKTVITASSDKTVRLREVISGKLLHVFEGHESIVNLAVFSSDNKLILSASWDETARLWDSASGKLIAILKGHNNRLTSVSISRDNKKILTSSLDGTTYLWDTATSKLIRTLNGCSAAIFSSDGNQILTASIDNNARLWDTTNGRNIKTFEGHESIVESVEFSSDDKTILTASQDGTARLWDASSGKLLMTLNGHENTVVKAKFSSDNKYALTWSWDNTVRIWEVSTGEPLHVLRGHKDKVVSALFSHDNKNVLTASWDKAALLWDVETGENILTYGGHTEFVTTAFMSLDNNTILTAYNNSNPCLWYTPSGKLLPTLNWKENKFNCAVFSLDNKIVAISKNDNSVSIWEVMSGKLLKKLELESGAMYTGLFSSNNEKLLTVSVDKKISLWDIPSGTLLRTFEGLTDIVKSIVFSSDEKMIFAVSWDETAHLWDLSSGRLIQTFGDQLNKIGSAVLSSDNKTVLTSTGEYTSNLSLWEVSSGKLIKSMEGNIRFINTSMFSLDNKMVLTASSDNTASLWDISTGKLIMTLEGHAGGLTMAVFSSDNNFILTASRDKTLRIWDVFSGKTLHILKGHSSEVNLAMFSNDGQTILSGSDDGSIIIWNAQTGQQLIRHFIFDSDPNKWVHIHPSGLFDASPQAMELMYWTKGLEVIEFAQLKDRYWVPGLWEKVMKGEPLPDVRDMQELKLQPEVELGELKDGKLPVTLTKRDGGYGKVTILINGKEVQADARGQQFDKSKETQTVWVDLKDHPNLENGENTVAVKASSEDGFVVGRPVEKKVMMNLQTSKPHFYAVVIGTGKFVNDKINLKYPEKDAQSMSTALQLGAEELFGKENTHIYTLTTASGDRPTKEKIKYVFTEISKKATSSDVIVIYLSGHGIAWGGDQGDFYYLTTDATAANADAYNDEALRKNYTISTSEFTEYLKAIPANKQVMIIDACSSGKAVENLMAARDIDVSSIKAIDRMKDRTGMFVISGSAADAVSYEASRYGQGLLTYSVLQAMKGAALRDGQFFDVNTILNYSRESVPKLAAGIGGIQTPQLLVPKGGSFDIGRVDEAAKAKIPLSNIKPVFVRTSFMDTEAFADDLNLSKLLDDKLNQIAMRGTDGQLVFLDTREFPDAYRLSGGYTQSNGTITLKLKIKGPKESEHSLSAKTKQDLVDQILEIVEGI